MAWPETALGISENKILFVTIGVASHFLIMWPGSKKMWPGSRKIVSPVKQQKLMQLVSQIWPIYFHKTTAQDKTKKTEVALSIERDVQPVHHAKNKKITGRANIWWEWVLWRET